jgi:hypothetical protein
MDRSMRRAFRTERACDGHHVIARQSSARRHRQGPKAARSAGGAKRSALQGAEHRCSIVIVMVVASEAGQPRTMADQHRMRHDFLDDFQEALERQSGREDASLVNRQFREIQGQFVRENVDAITRN